MQITYSYASVICNLYHVNYYYNSSYLRADEILYPCRECGDVKPLTLLVLLTLRCMGGSIADASMYRECSVSRRQSGGVDRIS